MGSQTFDEYWLGYLSGHSRLSTRLVHYAGLFFAPVAGIVASVVFAWWAFFIVAPVFYVAAFLTHPLIEHNTNRPFAERPLWSAIAFLRMLMLEVTGRLGTEMRRLEPEA
jgi:hypothetical protein